jgi:hypothetical protein
MLKIVDEKGKGEEYEESVVAQTSLLLVFLVEKSGRSKVSQRLASGGWRSYTFFIQFASLQRPLYRPY